MANQDPSYGIIGRLPLEIRIKIYRFADVCGDFMLIPLAKADVSMFDSWTGTRSRPPSPSIMRASKAIFVEALRTRYRFSTFVIYLYIDIQHLKIVYYQTLDRDMMEEYLSRQNARILQWWDRTIGNLIHRLPRRKTCAITSAGFRAWRIDKRILFCPNMIPGSALLSKVREMTGFKSISLEMTSYLSYGISQKKSPFGGASHDQHSDDSDDSDDSGGSGNSFLIFDKDRHSGPAICQSLFEAVAQECGYSKHQAKKATQVTLLKKHFKFQGKIELQPRLNQAIGKPPRAQAIGLWHQAGSEIEHVLTKKPWNWSWSIYYRTLMRLAVKNLGEEAFRKWDDPDN
ncbi:uncharacterized protein KY384_003505 [Bacidia gigantensis]|uniref:uncharacterized protein n=1 Tax=Bacidia gigantensis TaxID=2732470 RepID=UPI001D04B814|nr:uncharacterized protein KY384_003505 [Bacidia gigantensis]KAG8531869.1 hypothetical protein KY384_003505 [Bacidia gigantensis]